METRIIPSKMPETSNRAEAYRYRGRSESALSWRKERRQCCAQEHLPNAMKTNKSELYNFGMNSNMLVGTDLVIEPAFAVQELEEFHVCFSSPKIKITNLKVAPDCSRNVLDRLWTQRGGTNSDRDYMCFRRLWR
jgi:hypothetical protein